MSDQIQQIAARLRELRELREMSQEEAAAKLGHTLEEYRDFEDGRADIPVSLLHAAAELFGVDMTELLTGRAPRLRSFCLTRKGEGIKVERYKGYDFQSLAYNFIHRSVEPLLVTVDPSMEAELVTHPGQEFNYVVEGTVMVIVGEHEFILHEGDSLYFDPTIRHGQRVVGGEAKFLTIIL